METVTPKDLLIRPFEIHVQGFPPFTLFAATHGKARAKAYGLYTGYDDGATFKDFLKLQPSVKLTDAPEGFGQPLVVRLSENQHADAYFIEQKGNTITCALPGEDGLLHAHELDVSFNSIGYEKKGNGTPPEKGVRLPA